MRRDELLKDLNTYCKSDLDKELGSVLTCTIIDFIEEVQQKECERIVEMIEEENHRHVHTHRGYNQRQWCKECGENIITKIKKTVTLSVIR